MQLHVAVGRSVRSILGLTVVLAGCGSTATSGIEPPRVPATRPPAVLRIVTGNGQAATVSRALPEQVGFQVLDIDGQPVAATVVSLAVVGGGGWVSHPQRATDNSGKIEATWYVGPFPDSAQRLEARVGALVVTLESTALRPVPGDTLRGANGFIEWIVGDLPIVVSAPHGGVLLPSEIPDRSLGVTTRDTGTEELARSVGDTFSSRVGRRPHVVVCLLARRKLDANREIVEAAQGDPSAEVAWREYHGAIESAMIEAQRETGRAFYVDLHGHGHEVPRLELGYLLSASRLALPDVELQGDAAIRGASVWPIAATGSVSFTDVLRGAGSLGALFADAGFPSVPSPQFPDPGGQPYFDGGYSTARHSFSPEGNTAGVQIEAHFVGVRETSADRARFAAAVFMVLELFLPAHGWPFAAAPARLTDR